MININNPLNKFVIINLLSFICKTLRSTISTVTPFFKQMFIFYKRKIDTAAVSQLPPSQTRNVLQV